MTQFSNIVHGRWAGEASTTMATSRRDRQRCNLNWLAANPNRQSLPHEIAAASTPIMQLCHFLQVLPLSWTSWLKVCLLPQSPKMRQLPSKAWTKCELHCFHLMSNNIRRGLTVETQIQVSSGGCRNISFLTVQLDRLHQFQQINKWSSVIVIMTFSSNHSSRNQPIRRIRTLNSC